MKKINLLFLLLLLLSCEKDETVLSSVKAENGLTYNESLSKWSDLKRKNGNSYTYQVTILSWAGFGSVTELKIENGKVVSRNYQHFIINDTNGQREIKGSYMETKSDLGSHEDGAKPLTVDELYNSCARDYLTVDIKKNSLYFEAKHDGIMSLCGFSQKGCADDCFKGIYINSFIWN